MIKRLADESKLLNELTLGCQRAFVELYNFYMPIVFEKANNMVKDKGVAQEITQDVFIQCWIKREMVGAARCLLSYLHSTTKNSVLDRFRKLKCREVHFEQFKNAVSLSYNPVEEQLFLQESETILQRSIDKLSPQQREVFRRCRLDGATYKEAARALGISPYTVKEYLHIANQAIRKGFAQVAYK